MNTKNKQNEKNQRPGNRPEQRPKKQGRSSVVPHDQEHAETRLTR
jgi:hypothetical protein